MATSSIRIPKEDLPVLTQIINLDELEFRSLLSALREAKPSLSKWDFANGVTNKLKTIRASEIDAILRVVFILYSMKDKAETSAHDLAQKIAASYVKSISQGKQVSSTHAALLVSRIKSLLSCDTTVAVTAKAFDVMTEHSHVFCRARILSDIRPVFTESAESASAAVIIHNLQIGFHEHGTGPHKEFYVALDTEDIQHLKQLLERAEKKTIALKGILQASKVQYLSV